MCERMGQDLHNMPKSCIFDGNVIGRRADPTAQAAATEQTPSGINVQAQDATYYAVEGVNLRSDASADAEFVAGVLSGESLKCTGICDNGWIRVDYNGQTCYASGDYVSTTPPAGAAAATTDTAAAAQ